MIVIFDLDHTLMNSKKFKKQLPKIFGLSQQDFKNNINKYFVKQPDLYSPLKHVRLCYESGAIGKKQLTVIEKELKVLVKNTNSYIFPDAEKLLIYLRRKNNCLILLSHGEKKWQKLKIENLLIKRYFDKVIITDKRKTEAINFLKNKKDEILVINDNSRENKEMMDFLGRGKAILIRGIHSNDIKHNHKVYSLKQATKVIMNKF